MGLKNCAVPNCQGNSATSKLFVVPSYNTHSKLNAKLNSFQKCRRECWLTVLHFVDGKELQKKILRICSSHFVSGLYILMFNQLF